jgi:hypothetical protein
VYAVLANEKTSREDFGKVCHGPHLQTKEKKQQVLYDDRIQVLNWVAATFGWPCSTDGEYWSYLKAVKAFQSTYNTEGNEKKPKEQLAVDGDFGPACWRAVFDCYQVHLAETLECTAEELQALQDQIRPRFLKQYVGCGENKPKEMVGVDNYRSQTNRRVEILFFEPPDHVPETPCLSGECEPEGCELYDRRWYLRKRLGIDVLDDLLLVRLCGATQQPLPGGRCLHDTDILTADSDGYVEIPRKRRQQILLRWNPADVPAGSNWMYECELFSTPSQNENGSKQRLHNLGYSISNPLEDNVRAYQVDFDHEPTGNLDDIRIELHAWHDGGPSPASIEKKSDKDQQPAASFTKSNKTQKPAATVKSNSVLVTISPPTSHLSVGISVQPDNTSLAPENITLEVRPIDGGAPLDQDPNQRNPTEHGAVFYFKKVQHGNYTARAYVRAAPNDPAFACGTLDFTVEKPVPPQNYYAVDLQAHRFDLTLESIDKPLLYPRLIPGETVRFRAVGSCGEYTWHLTGPGTLSSWSGDSPYTGDEITYTATLPAGEETTVATIHVKDLGGRVAEVEVTIDWIFFHLAQSKIICTADDARVQKNTFIDHALFGGYEVAFGQDAEFSTGRIIPYGNEAASSIDRLIIEMDFLLPLFARQDYRRKAFRLFKSFQEPQATVIFWSDPDLNSEAEQHRNIISFVNESLNAPNYSTVFSPGKNRIHQALKAADWDINKAAPPNDLDTPNFNLGNRSIQSEDWGNGLKVMINGIQHVVVVAKDYYYDAYRKEYYIKLEYVFYDVFGIDDEDLSEFGFEFNLGRFLDLPGDALDRDFDTANRMVAGRGITAWWQLQHQHGYAPPITRISFEKEFNNVPAI